MYNRWTRAIEFKVEHVGIIYCYPQTSEPVMHSWPSYSWPPVLRKGSNCPRKHAGVVPEELSSLALSLGPSPSALLRVPSSSTGRMRSRPQNHQGEDSPRGIDDVAHYLIGYLVCTVRPENLGQALPFQVSHNQ